MAIVLQPPRPPAANHPPANNGVWPDSVHGPWWQGMPHHYVSVQVAEAISHAWPYHQGYCMPSAVEMSFGAQGPCVNPCADALHAKYIDGMPHPSHSLPETCFQDRLWVIQSQPD